MIDLQATFENFGDDYIQFERIESPRHPRPDVCAFLMLHELVPGTKDMVSASGRGEFFLGVDLEELAKVATEDIVRDLLRCGVMYSEKHDCLSMYA